MRKILFVLCFSLTLAIDPLFFIPHDKLLHGTFSYIKADYNETVLSMNAWESAVDIGLMGVAKEMVDVSFGGQFDCLDIAANYTGWIVKQGVKLFGMFIKSMNIDWLLW